MSGLAFSAGCCGGSGGGSSAVTSVFGRTGAITAQAGDYDAPLITFTPTATIPGQTDVAAALNYVSTSAYEHTVFVAQGHDKATDTRTGLAIGDMLHPFETLGAALAAITSAALTNVAVIVAAGYYDEDVSVPATVNIFGQGGATFITRLTFANASTSSLNGVTMYNDPAISVAPNFAPLEVSNGSIVYLRDVRAEDVFFDGVGGPPAGLLNDGSVFGWNSQFYCINAGNVVASEVFAGVRIVGNQLGGVDLTGCTMLGFTGSEPSQLAFGLAILTATNKTCELNNCIAAGGRGNAGGSGGGLGGYYVLDSTSTTRVTDGRINVTCNAGGGNSVGFQAAACVVVAGLSSSTVQMAGVFVKFFGQTAGGRIAGLLGGAGGTLTMLDMAWPDFTTTPSRAGAGGNYTHEGVLGNGTRFPAQVPSMVAGNTLWVDQGSPQATNTRTGLSPYDQARPFVTINAAITAASAGDEVIVRAGGAYGEDVVMKSGVTVRGAGAETILSGNDLTSDVVTFPGGCANARLENVHIYVPQTNGRGVVDASGQLNYVSDLYVTGGGNAGTVITKLGTNRLVVDGVYLLAGNVGILIRAGQGSPAGDIYASNIFSDNNAAHDALALAHPGGIYLNNVNARAAQQRGLWALDGGFITALNVRIEGADAAIETGGVNSRVFANGVVFAGCLVDIVADDASQFIGVTGFFDPSSVDIPQSMLDAGGFRGFSTGAGPVGDSSVAVKGFSTGTLNYPAQTGLGAGLPSQQGVVFFRNTNLAVGTWSDITVNMVSEINVDLFAGTAENNTLYVGSDVPFQGLIWNITTDSDNSSIETAVWNGVTWQIVTNMESDATAPYDRTFDRPFLQSALSAHRITTPSAGLLTLNGQSKYWVRYRASSSAGLFQMPRADYGAVVGSSAVRFADGVEQYFGDAEPERVIEWVTRPNADQGAVAPVNAGGIAAAVGLTGVTLRQASFGPGLGASLVWVGPLPPEADLSRDLRFFVEWLPATNNAGDVTWNVKASVYGTGGQFGSNATINTVVTVAAPGIQDQIQMTEINFNVGLFRFPAGPAILVLSLERDAADTYPNGVVLVSTELRARTWK